MSLPPAFMRTAVHQSEGREAAKVTPFVYKPDVPMDNPDLVPKEPEYLPPETPLVPTPKKGRSRSREKSTSEDDEFTQEQLEYMKYLDRQKAKIDAMVEKERIARDRGRSRAEIDQDTQRQDLQEKKDLRLKKVPSQKSQKDRYQSQSNKSQRYSKRKKDLDPTIQRTQNVSRLLNLNREEIDLYQDCLG